MPTFQPGDRVLVNETVQRGRERELIHHDGVVVEDPREGHIPASHRAPLIPVQVDLHEVDPSCRRGLMGIRFYKPGNLIAQPAVRVGPFVIDEDSGTPGSESSYEALDVRTMLKLMRDAAQNTPALDDSEEWTALIMQSGAALEADIPKAETYASVLRAEIKALREALEGVTRCLIEHLSQEAHDKRVSIEDLCPCYTNDVKRAQALLGGA